jgi:hypothetical protein
MMFRQLARAQEGTTVIEFALAAPIVLALLGGLFEVTRVLFLSALLEWSMADASRFGVTGQEGTDEISREQLIANIVEDRTLGLVDMEDANLETLVYPNFQSIGQAEDFDDENGNGLFDDSEGFTDTNGNGEWDEDMGLEGVGNADAVVLYRVTYDVTPATPFAESLLGRFTLVSTAAVRNEPF